MTPNKESSFQKYSREIDNAIYGFLKIRNLPKEYFFEEYRQEVWTHLLIREDTINKSYRNKAKFTTFLYCVVMNLCREISRSKNMRQESTHSGDVMEWEINTPSQSLTAESRLIIKDYCKRLCYILRTFINDRLKLLFCLDVFCRMEVTLSELQSLSQQAATHLKPVVDTLNQGRRIHTDQDIYRLLTDIFNSLESSQNENDAIRHWMEYRRNKIINVLNGNPPVSHFDKDSFQILYEICRKKSGISPNEDLHPF